MDREGSLDWKIYSGGRLLMACSSRGYFELTPGARALYAEVVGGRLVTMDLGPCSESNIEQCKQFCEEHRRRSACAPA